MQLATVTCPNQALTNCGHYTNVQYRDSEPNNTPENMYIAMHGSVRLLLPLKRICGYRNVWYFYRYHPMLSNGTRGLALPAYFELLPWGTFPVFTQRASCHFI